MNGIHTTLIATALAMSSFVVAGCGTGPGPGPGCETTATVTPALKTTSLTHRAYIASRDSGNVTVIDLDSLQVVASLDTPCSPGYHMVELAPDYTKAYASSPEGNHLDVIDARTLTLTKQIPVGKEPTHMSVSRDGRYLANVNENDNAVVFIDFAKDAVVKSLPGFYTPHFVRFAPDGRYAYVANVGAYHITRVDLQTLTIDGHIPLDGFQGPPNATETTEQVGFADVQIDNNGILWTAHGESGQILTYDTKSQTKLPEQHAGTRPWIVYAEHPFTEVTARVVPNHGDLNVRLFVDPAAATAGTVMTGEPESYGVNYSSLVPDKAFVMNRILHEVAVVNTKTNTRDAVIDVGGTTETASTTADGKYVVAAVSSANRVVVIDAVTNEVVKTFDNIGKYPWTVTIPQGQNYCH